MKDNIFNFSILIKGSGKRELLVTDEHTGQTAALKLDKLTTKALIMALSPQSRKESEKLSIDQTSDACALEYLKEHDAEQLPSHHNPSGDKP